jgi:Sulfatase
LSDADGTIDNGFHIGQHRLQPGKECGFEEDINVPLIIRGPNVARNATTDVVTTHTDLSPTFLNLIGAEQRPDFDGSPIPIHAAEIEAVVASPESWHEHVNVEFWGLALGEGEYGSGFPYFNNTYKGLRLVGKRFNLYYSVWCNNVHELYDLNVDPSQLHNLLGDDTETLGYPTTVLGIPVTKLTARLDSLLFVLKSCKGDTCVRPWAALHEDGVSSLEAALNPEYDTFYESEQVRIHYTRCELGYIIDAEGPQFDTDGLLYRNGAKWHEWI